MTHPRRLQPSDPLHDYLVELRRALHAIGDSSMLERSRILDECAAHLDDLSAELEDDGLRPEIARAEAIRRFGEPQIVARDWVDANAVRSRSVRWPLLSSIGLLIGLFVGLSAGHMADLWIGMLVVLPAAGIAIGACLGLTQRILLGARHAGALRWVCLTAVGMAVGLTFGTVAVEKIGLDGQSTGHLWLGLSIIGAAAGLAMGVLQWGLLRRHLVQGQWWILAMTAACAVGFLSGGVSVSVFLGQPQGLPSFIAFALVCAPTTGALSGFALNRLVAST